MEFQIKPIFSYHDVNVVLDNTTVSLGLHNSQQAMELAKTLKRAIEDLLDPDEFNLLMGIED